MKTSTIALVLAACFLPATAALAYEISTHALITEHAYRASVLNPSHPNSILPAIGFDRLSPDDPLELEDVTVPVEIRDEIAAVNPAAFVPPYARTFRREQQPHEQAIFDSLIAGGYVPGPSGPTSAQRVRSWLMRGTIREDDNDTPWPGGGWSTDSTRDRDPYGPAVRATKHFYDPVYDRPFDYDYCPDLTCVKSIVWSLGRTDPLNPANDTDDALRRNHFTWQDARNNFWWALTLKRDQDGDGYDFEDAFADVEDRMTRWGTMFQSIGQVIHLLQDTAQPQHVRNDGHAPPLVAQLGGGAEGTADASYEAFTDSRVLREQINPTSINFYGGNPLRRMDGQFPPVNALPTIRLGLGNYYPGGGSTVQFSTPVKFFTTRHIESGSDISTLKTRRGLADISNRNFFTAGTLPGFRECAPVGAPNCTTTPGPTYILPPNDLADPSYTQVAATSTFGLRVRDRPVSVTEILSPISDAIAPTYDTSTLAVYSGKVPVLTKSIWIDAFPDDLGAEYLEQTANTMTYNNMRFMADVMVPRAVGYSAGLINYFFRGRLEVTPIDQNVFAVLNQGTPHTMQNEWPRKVSAPTQTFGFDTVRLKVRNISEAIVESGTGQSVSQSTGGAGSRLVAIARYRLNGCYKPDLSGERQRPFSGAAVEPACGFLQRKRSARSFVSVSAPLTVTLGELDSAAVEKVFDFSADPIPVNATDLFIQVAYRGKLGDEADGIALGIYDSSEPTFVSFWNNTDYFWTGTAYMSQNATVPKRSVRTFYACAGVPSKLMYRYAGESTNSAMLLPPPANQVRLAMIFAKPSSPNQQFAVRAVPIMLTAPHASLRSSFTRGQIRQANKEEISSGIVDSPYEGCSTSSPAVPEYWCSDPIKIRRGIRFGEVAQPIYYSTQGAGDGPDVDSVPLPGFDSTVLRDGGELRFNEAGALENCPSQPLSDPNDVATADSLEAGWQADDGAH